MYFDRQFLNILILKTVINITVIVSLTVYLTYAWRVSKKTVLQKHYFVMHIFAILSIISSYTVNIAPDLPVKWICITAQYTAEALFSVYFLLFGYYFYRKRNPDIKIKIVIVLYVALTLLIVLSNPLHKLFAVQLLVNRFEYGPLCYAITFIGCIFIFTGALYICMAMAVKQKPVISGLLLALVIIPAFSIQFMNDIGMICNVIDMNAVFAFAVFTLLFIWAFRFGFLNTLNLGIRQSLEMFNIIILLFDTSGEIIYKNKTSEKYDSALLELITAECRNVFGNKELSPGMLEDLKMTGYGKTLSISVQSISALSGKIQGYVCIARDDTAIACAITDLKEKNLQLEQMNEAIRSLSEDIKRLAMLEERNLLAKDIHDVLGHSLNYTLLVLESNKAIIAGSPEKAVNRLRRAVADIDRGLGQICNITPEGYCGSLNNYSSFCSELKQIALRLKEVGVNVELSFHDDLDGCDERLFKAIVRICQEASTNSIKHGMANRVVISIKKTNGNVSIHIVDNGKGCKSIEKGSGLSGMEERIAKAGGRISFSGFDDGKGFLVRAVIPINSR